MHNLIARLEKLESKIRQLVRKMEMVNDENERLITENASLKKQLDDAKLQLIAVKEDTSEKIDRLNKEEISSKIDEYVEEIDACIDILKGDTSGNQ